VRRILTAREQYELWNPEPWRLAAATLLAPRTIDTPQNVPSKSMDKYGWTQDRLNANALSHWDAADEATKHQAGFWYPVAKNWSDHMTDYRGLSPEKGYGIIAAASPLRRWDGNLQDAHNFFTHWPHAPENIRKAPGLAAGQNLERMKRVYASDDTPEAIRAALSSAKSGNAAKKITNFYNNIRDPEDPNSVTIDSWMPRGILWGHGEEPSWPEELNTPVKAAYGSNVEYRDPTARDIGIKALGWAGGYDRMAEAIRHVARERNLPYAHVAQAGIWNKLGGTPTPDGDFVADHPEGPLTHIQDPSALYRYAWGQYSRQHPRGRAVAAREWHGYVDDHWDHLATELTPEEIAVHHGDHLGVEADEAEERKRRRQDRD
jgi:hypothetical protein